MNKAYELGFMGKCAEYGMTKKSSWFSKILWKLHKLVPAMGSFEIGQKNWGTYSPSVVSNAVVKGIPVKTTQKRTVR